MKAKNKIAHFLYMPLLGLGLYGGHRGSRWLKNRLVIFKQFVLPSLLKQTNKDFVLWVSVRPEDRHDKIIQDFRAFLEATGLKTVFTYSGICFWDDKYSDEIARDRLLSALHGSMGELINAMGEAETVLMTIQPSDDVYHLDFVKETQEFFAAKKDIHVYGYLKGYVMDYINRRLAEWNPKTTPPFYTIRFTRQNFTEPLLHINYTGPYKSHEFVKDFLPALYIDKRGFLVGTHTSNISTVFDHPYAGHESLGDNVDLVLKEFGLDGVEPLIVRTSIRSSLFHHLPYKAKRKLRFWAEKSSFFAWVYNWIRA
jgi:hypothetical protein